MMMKFIKRFYLGLILAFLYIPIVVLIVQSFNAGKSRAKWEGFSFRWYGELFHDPNIMNALVITLAIALLAAIFSTIIGTLAAIGIHAMKKRPQHLMLTLNNIPMTMPDIVTGISLMLLFIFTQVERGFVTMLLAHITFDVPYVILSVMPKLKQMNKHSYEAALDLGATPVYALTHVILPEVMPGVITGAMLAFTLSLDDFTISYFTTNPLVQNLSTLIYSQARKGIKPTMNALSALMFVALLALLLVVNKRSAKEEA
ncbi:MAG: ABC transporter permease [Clostridia bacterium]|nr:ABC transporter permease [Clostridia bacterium]